jgi:CDP-diacylglycerol--glycerol-3-phosphate 3-phosphatidyltransferase
MAREKTVKPRQMTLANKITVLRILAIPLLVIALIENSLNWARLIFSLSIFSDALDGAIARIRKERSALGSFLDPLADKLLLLATFMAFTYLGWVPVWVFVTIVSRDLLIILGWSVVMNRTAQPRSCFASQKPTRRMSCPAFSSRKSSSSSARRRPSGSAG